MIQFIYRILNKIEYLWKGQEFIMFHSEPDLVRIRNEVPLHSLIMDVDDPVRVSPGVYMFKAYNLVEKLHKRYIGVILGNEVVIEDFNL